MLPFTGRRLLALKPSLAFLGIFHTGLARGLWDSIWKPPAYVRLAGGARVEFEGSGRELGLSRAANRVPTTEFVPKLQPYANLGMHHSNTRSIPTSFLSSPKQKQIEAAKLFFSQLLTNGMACSPPSS